MNLSGWKHRPSISFVEAIRALGIPAPAQTVTLFIPTCPDTSLPWSADTALDGWSARMFLHQLLQTSVSHWKPSDTEQLLSDWTPQRLRGNPAKETSLSDCIKLPGLEFAESLRTPRMVRVLIRRALARGRSLRVLLRTEHDTIPVIVTFGDREAGYESWTAKSEKPLPDSLADGLLDFLKQHAPECAAIASSRK